MKRLFCLFLICCLLPVSAAAADKPLYSAGARISGPVYSEMRRDSSQTGRINPGYPIEVYALYPDWAFIRTAGVSGYVPRSYLIAGKPLDKKSTPPWGVVFYQYVGMAGENGVNILEAPDKGAGTLITLPADTLISVMDLQEGWARVAYYRQYGYIDTNTLRELLPICADASSGTDYAPIATFTSYYVIGSEEESVHGKEINIGINCEAMDGLILGSGESIDYDGFFGPYSPAKGYVRGPVLLEGGWGLGPGGGVCQVSSTLYNVLLQLPGINIIHHQSHGSNGAEYLPLEMDAAVGNPGSGIDLIFRNEYGFPVRFEARAQAGALFIALYRVTE